MKSWGGVRATSGKDESASFGNDIQSAKIDPDISSHETGEFLDETKALKRRQCEDKTTQVKGEGVSLRENVAKGLIEKYNLPEDCVQAMIESADDEDIALMQIFLNQENVLLESFKALHKQTEALIDVVVKKNFVFADDRCGTDGRMQRFFCSRIGSMNRDRPVGTDRSSSFAFANQLSTRLDRIKEKIVVARSCSLRCVIVVACGCFGYCNSCYFNRIGSGRYGGANCTTSCCRCYSYCTDKSNNAD